MSRPMCFVWDETVAKRGSEEIASCLFKYLKEYESGTEEIIFYSDCCPGQTRNIHINSMFLTLVNHFHEQDRSLVIHHSPQVSGARVYLHGGRQNSHTN